MSWTWTNWGGRKVSYLNLILFFCMLPFIIFGFIFSSPLIVILWILDAFFFNSKIDAFFKIYYDVLKDYLFPKVYTNTNGTWQSKDDVLSNMFPIILAGGTKKKQRK